MKDINFNSLKDYKKNEMGEYVYTGKTYVLKNNKSDAELIFKSLYLSVIIIAISEFIGGILPFEGMIKDRYIIIAYGLEWLFILFTFRGVATLSNNKYKLIEKKYTSTIISFPIYEIALFGLNILGIILSMLYVIKNGFVNDEIFFALYILVKVIIIMVTIEFKKLCNKLKYEEGS
ncbi:MAG: hypothetical protein Q4B60_05565 [Erysipelotrichaceae bacterium]|nr:hypothetical protein [Erysipelotrichaceae bacterium]